MSKAEYLAEIAAWKTRLDAMKPAEFLAELTALSHKHGIAIIRDVDNDFLYPIPPEEKNFVYTVNDEGAFLDWREPQS